MKTNLQIILVRPGATDLDQQGRITGTLDIPLNDEGREQAQTVASEIKNLEIDAVYSAPCAAAQQTAKLIAGHAELKVRVEDCFLNLDHGLWHGKLLNELKATHPKFFKQWQEHPESIAPPGGETLGNAQARVRKAIKRICKKHKRGIVVVVVPEPLRSILQNEIHATPKANIFMNSCSCGQWKTVEVPANA